MPSSTTNYSWNLPTLGGDEDAWGGYLNSNWSDLDTLLGGTNATEFAILDGATVTTAELNLLDGVTWTLTDFNGLTSTVAELNLLDGVTWTLTDFNGLTSTVAELNILDGATVTVAEVNILDGDTAATATTLVDGDRLVANDDGTMVQIAMTDVRDYLILDEDDMASDSATEAPSQQSVKAYVDASQSGMVRLATKVASASASLNFTEFDASLYSQYVFTISAIRPTADGESIFARFSSNGGSTFISANDYDYSLSGGRTNLNDFSENATNDSKLMIANAVDSDTAKLGLSATLNLYEPSLSASTILGGTAMWESNGGSRYSAVVHGYYQAARVVDAIQFFAQSGTLASGTITMYGLLK